MGIHMELVPAALEITGQGMAGVFAVILVIWAAVALLNRFTK